MCLDQEDRLNKKVMLIDGHKGSERTSAISGDSHDHLPQSSDGVMLNIDLTAQ